MTTAPRHITPNAPAAAAVALLWPGGSPEATEQPHLDPADAIEQNHACGGAIRVPPIIHTAVGTHSLTDSVSLTICGPAAMQPALDAMLAPLSDRLDVTFRPLSGSADMAAAAEDLSDTQGLIVFEGLAQTLAQCLSATGSEVELATHVDRWYHTAAQLVAALGPKTVLIPAEAVQQAPQAVGRALAAQYGHQIEAQTTSAEAAGPGLAAQYVLMAQTLVRTDPRLMTVLDKLANHTLACDTGRFAPAEAAQTLRHLLDQTDQTDQHAAHARDLRRVEGLAEANVQRLRHQTDAARMRVLEVEAISNRLSEEVVQSAAAAEYIKEELARREAVYAAQGAEVATLRRAVDQIEKDRKATSLKGNRLEQEAAALTRNIALRDDRIQGLATSLVGYEDEALALRDETRALHEEVAALRSSTSWRITSPLRGVILMVRKVLRRG